jgi:prolyl-tRNA synthetase
MRFSRSFIFTKREIPKGIADVNQRYVAKAGLVQQVSAGHHTYLPLGTMALRAVEGVIRDEMGQCAQEIIMPVMQPVELWEESGRMDAYGSEMFRLKNRQDREFCLGPTHEEVVVDLVRRNLNSYRDLPQILFQMGLKFRDEIRASGGILRGKEFLMKDAYSFDTDHESMVNSYEMMRQAYQRICERVGVVAKPVLALAGEIGGKVSEEFIADCPTGKAKYIIGDDGIARSYLVEDGTPTALEDICDGETREGIISGIEIGHIFQLGDRYSNSMKLTFSDKEGNQRPVIMGCYGIGVVRLLAAVIEQNFTERGLVWPDEVTPFNVSILPLKYSNPQIGDASEKIYRDLQKQGSKVILDDRDVSAGVKFNDSDLLGARTRIILGNNFLKNGEVDIEDRKTGEKRNLRFDSSETFSI